MKTLENRQMNFLQELNQKEKVNHKDTIKKVILFCLPVLLAGTIAGVFIYIKIITAVTVLETEMRQTELYSEDFMQKQEQMAELIARTEDLKSYNDNYDRAVGYIDLILELDSDTLDGILKATDKEVKISHINFDGKGITLDLGTNQYKQSVLFVERLEQLEFVESVKYEGFSSMDNGFSEYEFPVYIILKNGTVTEEVNKK